MSRLLKDHFIPHSGNGYKPLFLRFKSAFLVLSIITVVEGLYLLGSLVILPKNENYAAILVAALIDETNHERVSNQLGTLNASAALERAAQLKADDMAAKGYFAHNSPDGKTPWYWFGLAGYNYAAAGENLAVNFTDSKDVTEAWLRSPAHRANIMSGNYTEIGIATAVGTYKGKSAIFVVQEFGRPSVIARDVTLATTTQSATSQPATNPLGSAPARKLSDIRAGGATKQKVERTDSVAVTKLRSSSTPALPLASAPATSSIVAGVETKQLNIPEPIFVETAEASTLAAGTTAPKINTIITSPRRATTSILLIVAVIIAIALLLAIFIKIRIQHPHLIANGILLLAILLGFIVLNAVMSFYFGMI